MNAPRPNVTHNASQGRFEAEVEGQRGLAAYTLDGQVMQITHTEVPAALEGQGVAGALVQAALDHARAQGLKVQPMCSYARAYMERHPDTQDLRAD